MVADKRAAGVEGANLVPITLALFGLLFYAYIKTKDRQQMPFTIPPRPTEWVWDEANVLSPGFVTAQRTKLEGWHQATQHRFIVYVSQISDDHPSVWCPTVFNAWAVGRPTHNDGVVLFLFTAQNTGRWITLGLGLEAAISDAQATEICTQTIKPLMDQGNYDGAVAAGVAAITGAIDAWDEKQGK